MLKRIGFCCKVLHNDRTLKPKQLLEYEQPMNCRGTTVRYLNEHPDIAFEKMWDVTKHNIESVYKLVEYVGGLNDNQHMVRISSPVLPMATEPTWGHFWNQSDVQTYIEREFAKVGNLARSLDVRLSFHPGQFCVLASLSDDVLNRSVEEFEYHANMARYMGYGKSFQDFKINVHISGRKGPEGIKAILPKLSPEARNCITIENDEMTWGLDASLELVKEVALVVDIHHHWVHSAGEYIKPNDDRIKRVIDSWRGVRPVIHFSTSREDILVDHDKDTMPNFAKLTEQGHKKTKLRAHSDFMWNNAVNDWALSHWEWADIQTEAKMKNLASTQLLERARQTNVI